MIKSDLLSETLPWHLIFYDENLLFDNIIRSTDSVFISLRKWEIEVDDKRNIKLRSVCNVDYYRKNMN